MEAHAFLLAASLSRSGRDQPARQVLQLLGTASGWLQSLAAEAGAMVVRSRANTLVRQHILQPYWSEPTIALRHLLAAAPAAFSDRNLLEWLAERTAARGTEVFGAADHYAHLSEAERTLVNRLANEVP